MWLMCCAIQKGLLTSITLILAFRTRKVKVKGLDDSKYITASVYVTSVSLGIVVISVFSLPDFLNTYAGVVGAAYYLSTTTILILVAVPKVS